MSNELNPEEKQQPPPEPVTPVNIDEADAMQQPLKTANETNNLTDQTTNMEVHHHAHHGHGKKTWKSYFWEFFMLFLAVFCGSLAELQVEHYIEHNREKNYAQTLYEDLVSDSTDLSSDIKFWDLVVTKVDTIRTEIERPEADRNYYLIYKCNRLIKSNNTFLYHDRTIQQLKSSGNFRLIRNKEIADSIVNYDAWIQKTINDIENIYGHVLSPQIILVENQLFNSKLYEALNKKEVFDSIQKENPEMVAIRKDKQDLLFQYYNKLYDYKGLAQARVYFLRSLLRRGINLLAMLKKQYHVE